MNSSTRVFLKIIVLGLIIQLGFFLILISNGLSYPHTSFLFDPRDRFNDFYNSILTSSASNPYEFNGPAIANYFPFTYVLLKLISVTSKGISLFIFLTASIFSFVISSYYLLKSLNLDEKTRFYIILALIGSYPFIFAIDRGNLDAIITSLIMLSLYFVNTASNYKAAIMIGLAGSLKGYPLIFIFYFYKEKDYRSVFISLGTFTLLTAIGLILFKGNVHDNLMLFLDALKKFKQIYIIGNGSMHFCSDLYNGIKIANYKFHFFHNTEIFYKNYLVASTITSIFLLIFIIKRNLSMGNTIALLSLIGVFYPAVANDYKLMLLYPALFYLLKEDSPKLKISIILIGLLIIPKNYYVLASIVNIGTLINPIIFIVLLISIIYANCKNPHNQ